MEKSEDVDQEKDFIQWKLFRSSYAIRMASYLYIPRQSIVKGIWAATRPEEIWFMELSESVQTASEANKSQLWTSPPICVIYYSWL